MTVLIYDNSFEGLLSAIYTAYYSTVKPERIETEAEHEINFLYEEVFVKTDVEKAKKVSGAIRSRISNLALELIFNAFLSELPGVSTYIYHYVQLGFKTGPAITTMHANEIAKRVHDASSKTTREQHLLLGLVRFKRLNGDLYYAAITPDHNIATLLAPHFADRLSDQRWIIHDTKRKLAVAYDKNTWVLRSLPEHENPFNPESLKEANIDWERLWRLYFNHIAIETRRNPKLQKQFMPKRYWHLLPEKLPGGRVDKPKHRQSEQPVFEQKRLL